MLQELFDESLWFYREERKPKGMSKLRKKLAAAGIKFTPSFYVYFAVCLFLLLKSAHYSCSFLKLDLIRNAIIQSILLVL